MREKFRCPTRNLPTPIALLKADHRKVEGLFEKFEGASAASAKQKLAQQICTELKIHTTIEEELFYPAFRGKIEDDTLDEAYVEHDGAKVLINDIVAGSPEDDFYDAKVHVLSEEIKHHVHEEEMPSEGMFAQCRKTDVDLVALGEAMLARKRELTAQAETTGLPPSRTARCQPPAGLGALPKTAVDGAIAQVRVIERAGTGWKAAMSDEKASTAYRRGFDSRMRRGENQVLPRQFSSEMDVTWINLLDTCQPKITRLRVPLAIHRNANNSLGFHTFDLDDSPCRLSHNGDSSGGRA